MKSKKNQFLVTFCTLFLLSSYANERFLSTKEIPPLPYASIWTENFTGITDGATSDSGSTAWTTTITQGTFEVQNGLLVFQGTNSGSNATWTSQDIDISNYSDISISYLVGDLGIGAKETSDYVRGYYVLNNGSRVQFGNTTDDIPSPLLESVSGLNGNTLRIEIDFLVSYGNESFNIDDITVEGTSLGDSQLPSAPASLISTSTTTSTITLNWNASTDNIAVTGYKIYQDNAEIESNWNTTSYQATNLNPSTTYQFYISALDAAGNESSSSNTISTTTNTDSGGTSSGNWSLVNTDLYYDTGNIAIGTTTVPTGYKLAVNGSIITTEVLVKLKADWPDYVFKDNYTLPTLKEVAKHIEENGHLINIPSAAEVEANGIELGEMNKLLLEKIEELTLYILEQQEQINTLKVKVNTEILIKNNSL